MAASNPARRACLGRIATVAAAGVAGVAGVESLAAAAGQVLAVPAFGSEAPRAVPTAADDAAPPPRREADDAPPPLGSRIEVPSVTLLDGTVLPPQYWVGKVLVVELWASWCPFCARQNPHVDALHRANRDRGLEVLALSIDRDPEAARRYMAERGYAFHAAMFDERWQAAIGRPKGLPIVWVIDRDSRLAKIEIGEMFPEDIAELGQTGTETKR